MSHPKTGRRADGETRRQTGRDTGRSRGGRAAGAAAAGLVAGACGLVVIRVVFGPGVVLAGALVGGLAMVVASVCSWIGLPGRRVRAEVPVLPGGRRLRTRTHPVAWAGPVAGSLVAVVAFAGVAHSSGSGWVQAVGALLAAVLVTGLVAPAIPGRRGSLVIIDNPADAEAGRSVTLSAVASGPLRIRPLFPRGPAARASGAVQGPRQVEITLTPDRRGVITALPVEVASCAPFGLLWWAREVQVPLPRPLHVAPRLGELRPVATLPEDRSGDAPLRVPAGVGELRGVRPYEPGDTRRIVHWPATSHVGSVMVRERERQSDSPVVFDLQLPVDPLAAETEAEAARASLTAALRAGTPVILQTREENGTVVRPLRDLIDLGRRLARAVAPPATAPDVNSHDPSDVNSHDPSDVNKPDRAHRGGKVRRR